jgi:hypothetical protein
MTTLVTVKVYDSLPEAEVARAMLEQHGFFAFLPDKNVVSAAWYLTQAVGGIRLQVPEGELDSVRPLLGGSDDALVKGGVDSCPECGSGDVFRSVSLVAGIAALVLSGMPLLMRRRGRYCWQCRHKWLAAPN